MKNTIKKITACLASALIFCGQLPLEQMIYAADEKICTLDEFASRVQNIIHNDNRESFYDTLTYDKQADMLYRDDDPVGKSYGEISVSDGRLYVGEKEKRSIRQENFKDAAAQYGYTLEETDEKITLTNEFQTARLIVKAHGLLDSYGALKTAEGYRDLHIFQYASSKEAYDAYQKYQADSQVEFVQPSHIVTLEEPLAEDEYAAMVAGVADHSYHTWGADDLGIDEFISKWLDAEQYPEVIVAVVDTGINRAHSELSGRILEDEANFSDSGDDTANDDYGHGTHCTGTICELTTDNVKILPIKVFDQNGSGTDEEIYMGLMYAMEHDADIVSMSFGGLGVSPLEIEAMTLAEEHGMTCVAAAGNNADDAAYYYPGGIESCITVAAIDSDYQLAKFSNHGNLIDVSAPGVDITSLTVGEDGTLVTWNGTSMATPHVTACCALLKTLNPDYTPAEIQALLQVNAMDIGEKGFDTQFGWGLVCMKDFDFCNGVCHAPVFSLKSGNYGNPIVTKLTCPTADAEIYYTTDGTKPSAENGILYTEAIEIDETTRIRAVAVKDGYRSSIETESIYMLYGLELADPWIIENNIVTAYKGVLAVPQIPQGIIKIGDHAFKGNTLITKIVLPDSVKEIGNDAFSECSALENVSAAGVESIGEDAFRGCISLEKVEFASPLTNVGAGAFAKCEKLEQIDLTGIRNIPAEVLAGCAVLKKAFVPDAVTIDDKAFSNCVVLSDLQCNWKQLTTIGAYSFENCSKLSGECCLTGLQSIGEGAFDHASGVQSVVLSEQVTTLPKAAFEGCIGLTYFSAPCVTILGDDALAVEKNGFSLVSELPYEKITQIGTNAFRGFNIGDGYNTVSFDALEKISFQSFAGAYAATLRFPNAKTVSAGSFEKANVKVVELPLVKSLPEKSVQGCSYVVISNTCSDIAPDAGTEDLVYLVSDTFEFPQDTELSFRTEPIILKNTTLSRKAAQHAYLELAVLAGGYDVTYQWYKLIDNEKQAIVGADQLLYIPNTTEIGAYDYLCIASANGIETEPIFFHVEVNEESLPKLSDEPFFNTTSSSLKTLVFDADSQMISAFGDSRLIGVVTDSQGNMISEFSTRLQKTDVLPHSDTPYYLHFRMLFSGMVFLSEMASDAKQNLLDNADVDMQYEQYLSAEKSFEPQITVKMSDGMTLTNGKDYLMQIYGNSEGFVYLFGCGSYCGYQKIPFSVYRIAEADTPASIDLKDAKDTQTYVFIPKESGEYYFYSTYNAAYKEECEAYQRTGKLPAHRSYSIQTSCTVYDSEFEKLLTNSYSTYTGNTFSSKIKLTAGQKYYFVCKANASAAYNLMVSQTFHDLKKIEPEGSFTAKYNGKSVSRPEIDVSLNGELLVENQDYVVVYGNNDVPGIATATIVGIGQYVGSREISYLMTYSGLYTTDKTLQLEESSSIQLGNQRIAPLWFTADSGQDGVSKADYAISMDASLNLRCAIFSYNPNQKIYSYVLTTDGKSNVTLKNGRYCLVFYMLIAEKAANTSVTVFRPYNLEEAEVFVDEVIYTGGNETPNVKVISDGTELELDKHYKMVMPDNHAMFGEQEFMIVPASKERAYGNQIVHYNVVVSLPEDAPFLSVGTHEASVSLENRLAVYRLQPTEKDTSFLLESTDVMNTAVRVFDDQNEMLAQSFGTGTVCMDFLAEKGKSYYIMVKFNSLDRRGTLHFTLLDHYKLLDNCVKIQKPVFYTGEKTVPDIQFMDGDTVLEENKDYQLRYCCDEMRIGTASANFVGIDEYFGSSDVSYDIIAENLFDIKDFEAFPMRLDVDYSGEEQTECDYMIYSYSSGIDTKIRISIYNLYCTMTMQLYDTDGHFIAGKCFDEGNGELEYDISAGDTVYILLSATNINSWNQIFSIVVEERNQLEFQMIRDTENGVIYRICPSLSYAEVYALETENCNHVLLSDSVGGYPLRFIPEAVFADLPDAFTVYGYHDCIAAAYSDKYHFAYLNPSCDSLADGDLNGDGYCSIADAVLLSYMICEVDSIHVSIEQWNHADINDDGILNLSDVQLLIEKYLKKS